MSTMAIPHCTNNLTEKGPDCGLPMIRIGKEGEQGVTWTYVCPVCDGYGNSPENKLAS